ncbi:hypothetical protein NM688_g3457 [Phlebia brevispora]|uniref:Uncharacterized protein n=1 Tax=Phlebia brevispora TaxID=194682 RepID=A0ACC1T5Y1_9APHY|nr:hypothetical protein NM688_g3457 [Phlebia brevispora]
MYDEHNSHFSVELINAAIEHNVILFALLPHTMHRLQLCDVGAFSLLKRAWLAQCQEIIDTTRDQMHVRDVVQEYMQVRRLSFKKETIIQAFKKSGITTNSDRTLKASIDAFSPANFAPSISTSTQLHLPQGYPEDHGDVLSEGPVSEPEYVSSSDDGSDDEDEESYIPDLVDLEHEEDHDKLDHNRLDHDGLDRNRPDLASPDYNSTNCQAQCTDHSSWRTSPHEDEDDIHLSDEHSDTESDDGNSSESHSDISDIDNPVEASASTSWIVSHLLIDHYSDSDDKDEDEPDVNWTDAEKVAFWKARSMRLQTWLIKAREERDATTSHAVLVRRNIHRWRG